MNRGHNRAGGIAGEQLSSLLTRIENLEEQKAEIAADIREVYAEAKGNGFDPKTMRHILKLRKMEQAERDEYEALIDIYKAALGMLDGTPLGEAAIRRLSKQNDNPVEEDAASKEPASEPTEGSGASLEDAREMAKQTALDGKPVTSNPFPARDPRRAAWDEEWCKTAGSDGMELPDAWRRTSKKPEGKGDDEETK